MIRSKLFISGTVQGVGFRPFIYNLALKHNLCGWVLNSTDGVHLEVEGTRDAVDAFLKSIRPNAPPLARIDAIQTEHVMPIGYEEFTIRHSEGNANQYVKISPDVCTCEDCLREMRDPENRRYRYPFTNCTNCGPRYTIIEDIPYDRPKTTMREFAMCPPCQAEYDNPGDRRFHAQPNACAVCGPKVWVEQDGKTIGVDAPISHAIKLLASGRILGIRGLGGYHLACDATNAQAVSHLRERKHRILKPFAIMSLDVASVRKYCDVSVAESELLQSIRRPIVLLDQKQPNPIAPAVAPNVQTLGVMLPYTPLHFLLLDKGDLLALVMTSANLSEEPIVTGNGEARERLASLADAFLMHNRDICTRCDDSVVRVIDCSDEHHPPHISLIRRSRGYAPEPIDLDTHLPSVLACGGELKNTFCLTQDNHAFLSQHIGDLQNAEAYTYFTDSIEYIKRLFRVSPEAIAHDLHPEYLSTKYALAQQDMRPMGIQHHHAHIASCMAEHGIDEPVLGVALDGTGYGTDGTIWGGEFLWVNGAHFQRLAHLRAVPLPGGDAAAKQVWRMGLSYLWDAYGEDLWELAIPFVRQLDRSASQVIIQMIQRQVNAPLTSSAGRLFDAASALTGICTQTSYEGQAAIEFEAAGNLNTDRTYAWGMESTGHGIPYQLDTRPILRGMVEDCLAGVSTPTISGRFHHTLVALIADVCSQLSREYCTSSVALSGGVFQNRTLLHLLCAELGKRGLVSLVHARVPANDGGICLGQAWIAAKTIT